MQRLLRRVYARITTGGSPYASVKFRSLLFFALCNSLLEVTHQAKRSLMKSIAAAILIVAQSSFATAAPLTRLYHVGNSLTFDMAPSNFDVNANSSGIFPSVTGHHIRCTWGPTNIWRHPDETCIVPQPSTWDTAIPASEWDALSFQLHHGPADVENLGLQTQAIVGMYEAAAQSSNPALILFTPAPRLSWNLENLWESPTVDADGTRFLHSREYVNHLESRLQSALPDTTILRIDGPQLQIDLIDAGLAQDRAEFYRDDVHGSRKGGWVGHVAHLELRYGPRDWSITGGAFDDLDPDWRRQSTLVIRNRLQLTNDMIEGDFDGDGSIDAVDYILWRDTFGSRTELLADGNNNGIVDAADYNIWRNNFAPRTVPLPEPGGLLTCFVATVPVAVWRLRTVRHNAHSMQ